MILLFQLLPRTAVDSCMIRPEMLTWSDLGRQLIFERQPLFAVPLLEPQTEVSSAGQLPADVACTMVGAKRQVA